MAVERVDHSLFTSVDMEFRPMPRAHEQARRVRLMELEIRLASVQRCASQFDPAIDKERKFISNLWWNMPVLPDSPECAALRANMKEDRLNSRSAQKSAVMECKAHG